MIVTVIALRYLRTRPMALVAGLFLATMVAAMVVVTGVMEGFQARIRSDIRGVDPDLTFRWAAGSPGVGLDAAISRELAGELESAGGPLRALAPRAETMGILQVGLGRHGYRYEGVRIRGIDFARDRHVVPWDRLLDAVEDPRFRVTASDRPDPLSGRAVDGILVGRELALDVSLRLPPLVVGTDVASLVAGRVVADAAGRRRLEPSNLRFAFAGSFFSGRPDHDGKEVYISLAALRTLRHGDDPTRPDCTEVVASLVDPERVEDIAEEIRRRHPRLSVTTWMDANRPLLEALSVEKTVTSVILLVIVGFAVALLFGVLYLMVIEKRRDVGILRTMGLSRGRVVLLFSSYGLALGAIFVGIGSVAGVLVVRYLTPITDFLYERLGVAIFDRELFESELPVVLDHRIVALIGTSSLAMTLLAAMSAAKKAASLEPMDGLNQE